MILLTHHIVRQPYENNLIMRFAIFVMLAEMLRKSLSQFNEFHFMFSYEMAIIISLLFLVLLKTLNRMFTLNVI